jgi:hypothetical protein
MKLRIRGNSIRLRLTQSEVARLRDEGVVEESCDFGGGHTFRYTLESNARTSHLDAALDGSSITVSVPAATARAWATNDEVGMYGASGPVDIAIEKDFRCISHGDAEGPDAFPNPAATTN